MVWHCILGSYDWYLVDLYDGQSGSQREGSSIGIVFSDHMIGTSLIYTMGNPAAKEKDRPLALYQYNNMQKSSKKVKWDASVSWKEELVQLDGDSIKIVYTAPIDESPIDLDTKEVNLRYAFGPNDYNIEYHTFSGR